MCAFAFNHVKSNEYSFFLKYKRKHKEENEEINREISSNIYKIYLNIQSVQNA